MKQKRDVSRFTHWLALLLVLIMLAGLLAPHIFSVPARNYAPGLYVVGSLLEAGRWYDIATVGAYRFPACALVVSDGYTYLTIDPDMTQHCEER